MRLSDLKLNDSEVLVRDGDFKAMNYCTSETESPFLTFLEREKFIDRINRNAKCVICSEDKVKLLPSFIEGVVSSNNPKYTFHRIYNEFSRAKKHDKRETKVGEGCNISKLAYIAENNVVIGNGVIIEPFAVINENVTIEDGCVIHSNAVIGGVSFSFARSASGEMENLSNNGKVIIKKNVEIMCHTHIAQGIWEDDVTYIGYNSKIDAHCHIGHGARIGNSVLIAAGAVIGGNAYVDDDVWVGINATVSNRIRIGKNARVNLGAVVTKNVDEGEAVSGNFAIRHDKLISIVKSFKD